MTREEYIAGLKDALVEGYGMFPQTFLATFERLSTELSEHNPKIGIAFAAVTDAVTQLNELIMTEARAAFPAQN